MSDKQDTVGVVKPAHGGYPDSFEPFAPPPPGLGSCITCGYPLTSKGCPACMERWLAARDRKLAVVCQWIAKHYRDTAIQELSLAMTAAAAGPPEIPSYKFAGSTPWIESVDRRLSTLEGLEEWIRKIERRLIVSEDRVGKFERRLEPVEAMTTQYTIP